MPGPERPRRIQRQRTKGWRMPKNTVYVGRPSKWGNSYELGDLLAHEAVALYRAKVMMQLCNSPDRKASLELWLAPLRGKHLACWCPLDQPCHADVLLELANDHP